VSPEEVAAMLEADAGVREVESSAFDEEEEQEYQLFLQHQLK
jgi:hypothetical protein